MTSPAEQIAEAYAALPDPHEALDAVWYALKIEAGLSYPEIGSLFGGYNHTSVRDGVLRHCERRGLPTPRFARTRAEEASA